MLIAERCSKNIKQKEQLAFYDFSLNFRCYMNVDCSNGVCEGCSRSSGGDDGDIELVDNCDDSSFSW